MPLRFVPDNPNETGGSYLEHAMKWSRDDKARRFPGALVPIDVSSTVSVQDLAEEELGAFVLRVL
ncbi:MAG: hypothetical protein QHC89_26855, partial [Bosea sp. (in: a-proteobacteria)]|nr:hypothetical protein [Bosea sp. (in: a-proteobacteria)]